MKRFELKPQIPNTPVRVIDVHVNRVVEGGGNRAVYTQQKVGTIIFTASDGYSAPTGPIADSIWAEILEALLAQEVGGDA